MTDIPLDVSELAGLWWSEAWRLSWQVGIFVVIVGLLAMAARRAAPELRYLLWSLVLLRLAVPIGFRSPLGLIPARGDGAGGTSVTVLDSTFVSAPTPGAAGGSSFDLASAALLLWLAGVATLALVATVRLIIARRTLAGSADANARIRERVARLSEEIGLARPPRVVVRPTGSRLPAPAVFGLARPVVVLPAFMNDAWMIDDVEPVLVHELAHIRRRDHLVNALQLMLQIAYFFHPLVWLANWRLRVERELACDDAVVRRLGAPGRYAKSLVRFAECQANRPARAALAVGMAESTGTFSRRIARMFDSAYAPHRAASTRSRLLAAGLVALGIVSLVIAADATARGPELTPSSGQPFDTEILYTRAVEPSRELSGGLAQATIHPMNDRLILGRELWRGQFEDPSLLEGMTGSVVVGAWIDPQGKVREAEVLHGASPQIDKMFQRYLETFEFEPSSHEEIGSVSLRVLVNFVFPPRLHESLTAEGTAEGTATGPLIPGIDGVGAPIFVSRVDPVYPEAARKARIAGKVILRAVIETDGSPRNIVVLREPGAHLGFSEAAIAAVSQWRYKPATQGGRPVAVYFTVVMNFSLQEDKTADTPDEKSILSPQGAR